MADGRADHGGSPDLEAIRAGSVEAFQDLFDRHREPLLRVADRILGDPGLAEDAVQETFLLVFRRIGSFRGEASLGSWIMRIAIHESLRIRAQRRTTREIPDDVQSRPDETPEQNEALRALDAAVDRLPLQQRLVFCLVQVEGMTREDAAHALDLAEGTVRFHLHAARARLKEAVRPFLQASDSVPESARQALSKPDVDRAKP